MLKASVGSSLVRFGRARALLLAALVAGALAAAMLGGGNAAGAGTALDSPGDGLHATIRTTSHGIPHILASNFAGLGYGYGGVEGLVALVGPAYAAEPAPLHLAGPGDLRR